MPVGRVGGGTGGNVLHDFLKGVATGGGPEADSVGTEVNLIGKVEPGVGREGGGPLGNATYAPLECGKIGAHTDFEFGKVGLEEVELMLGSGRSICLSPLRREVVVESTSTEVGSGLRDQLGTLEVVPFRVAVDGELQSVALFSISRVFV